MPRWLLLVTDLVAISIVVFALYLPRHRRGDLVVAYLGANVSVLAVAHALSASEIGAGLGLGLFGVLSIVRLRSSELQQSDIAYYFAALALGLLGALDASPAWMTPILMALIVVTLFVADHPRIAGRHRRHTVQLEGTFLDTPELRAELSRMLGGTVHDVRIQRVDLVRRRTSLEVRYSVASTK